MSYTNKEKLQEIRALRKKADRLSDWADDIVHYGIHLDRYWAEWIVFAISVCAAFIVWGIIYIDAGITTWTVWGDYMQFFKTPLDHPIVTLTLVGPTILFHAGRWVAHWVAKRKSSRLQRKADLKYEEYTDRAVVIDKFLDGAKQVIDKFSKSDATVNRIQSYRKLSHDLESAIEELKSKMGKEFAKLKDEEKRELVTKMLHKIKPDNIEGLSESDVESIKYLFNKFFMRSR